MKLAAALLIGLKVMTWASVFVILTLTLEVNSTGDRVIQRAVWRASSAASHTLDYLVDLTR